MVKQNMFAAELASQQKFSKDSLHHVTLKILKGTVSGRLSSNPAIMGMVLQCMDMLERRERGCGMKGPKNRTDVETDLLEEAALLLTSNGCPGDLMQHFGFSQVSILRTLSNLDTLTSRGSPCPVLACIFQAVMQEDIGLIDSLLVRPTQNRKRMVMCFDFTYLLPMHCSLTLNKERALVGGPFQMDDIASDSPGCFQRLAPGFTMTERAKANRMLLGVFVVFSRGVFFLEIHAK